MSIHYVYIAGPYSGTPDIIKWNVDQALKAFHELLDYGLYPYIPHLFRHAEDTEEYDYAKKRHYETWMALDMAWLKKCDALLRINGQSPGADRELQWAFGNNVPIFFSVKQLMDVLRGVA